MDKLRVSLERARTYLACLCKVLFSHAVAVRFGACEQVSDPQVLSIALERTPRLGNPDLLTNSGRD